MGREFDSRRLAHLLCFERARGRLYERPCSCAGGLEAVSYEGCAPDIPVVSRRESTIFLSSQNVDDLLIDDLDRHLSDV